MSRNGGLDSRGRDLASATLLTRTGRAQQTQVGSDAASSRFPAPRRLRERLVGVVVEMALLQPVHEDLRIACRATIRLAIVPRDMRPSRQVARIGTREQLRERVELNRIDC